MASVSPSSCSLLWIIDWLGRLPKQGARSPLAQCLLTQEDRPVGGRASVAGPILQAPPGKHFRPETLEGRRRGCTRGLTPWMRWGVFLQADFMEAYIQVFIRILPSFKSESKVGNGKHSPLPLDAAREALEFGVFCRWRMGLELWYLTRRGLQSWSCIVKWTQCFGQQKLGNLDLCRHR